MFTTNMDVVQAAVCLVGLFAALHVLSIALGFVRLVVKWTLVVFLVTLAVAFVLDIPVPSTLSSYYASTHHRVSNSNNFIGRIFPTASQHHKAPQVLHSTPTLDALTDMLGQTFSWAQSSVMQAIKNEPFLSTEKTSDHADLNFFRSILPDSLAKSVKSKPTKLKRRH